MLLSVILHFNMIYVCPSLTPNANSKSPDTHHQDKPEDFPFAVNILYNYTVAYVLILLSVWAAE